MTLKQAANTSSKYFKVKFGDFHTKFFFLLVLSLESQAAVNMYPSGTFVSVLDGSFQVVCSSDSTMQLTDVQWLVNGSPLENLNLHAETNISRENGYGYLRFNNNLQRKHNNSVISCTATFDSDEMQSPLQFSKLIIQGYLGAVGHLTLIDHNFNIFLVWTRPFTLDITEVEPDICGYCVEISAEFEDEIPSSCEIMMPHFNFTLPYKSVCYTYNFTVYALNVVGNGTRRNKLHYKNETSPEVRSIDRILVTSDESAMDDVYTYLMTMTAEICGPVALNFTDLNFGSSVLLDSTFLNITNATIAFTTENLMLRREYNITVDIDNGLAVSYIIMSTHGILNATPMFGGDIHEVSMMITYYNNSNTRGAFLSVVFINDGGVDLTKSHLLSSEKNSNENNTLPQKLHSPGTYKVQVYDLGRDGTLPTGVVYPAASTGAIPVDGDNQPDQKLCHKNCTSCDVLAIGLPRDIIVECRFLDYSATGMQVIVQSANASEVHKLYVNQSIDLNTPVTVSVERDGEYQVSIFATREGMGILGSYVQYTTKVTVGDASNESGVVGVAVGATIAAIFLISVAAVIILLVLRKVSISNGKSFPDLLQSWMAAKRQENGENLDQAHNATIVEDTTIVEDRDMQDFIQLQDPENEGEIRPAVDDEQTGN